MRTNRTDSAPSAPPESEPRVETGFVFAPVRIGPSFEWLNHDNIRVLDGGLAGRSFRVETRILRDTAALSLYEQNVEVANESVERDPPGRGVILWDAGVREHLRGNGLSIVMTWIFFRELLAHQATASFRLRMIRSLKTEDGPAALQNVGVGVMALRFGFRPDPSLEPRLSGRHITDITVIPPGPGHPPALHIELDIDPLVIVAFVLNPDTMKPVQDFRYYSHLEQDRSMLLDCARQNLLAVSGNYCLRKTKVDHFVNRLAADEDEAIRFRHMVRGF